jgi:penicillin-binding protein 1B
VSRRSFAAWVALLFLGVVSASVIGLAVYSSFQLARFERAEARRTAYVYAAPQVLAPGVNIRLADLPGALARLHYTETRTAPNVPGQFRRAQNRWEIHVRAGATDVAHPVRIEVAGDRIARVERDGQTVDADALEPEVLTSAAERPGQDFRPLRLADAPIPLINAVLAAEDHRFFEHKGVDLRGLLRAAWTNLRAGRVRQGGSTITQQLVKNRLLTPKRTFLRKLDEAWLAALVEWRYSKPQILEAYVNEIYLGQRGALAIRGIGAAARSYFGKEVHQLSLGEQALLAGLARAPNLYSPAVNPDRARERRNVVLGRMRSLEMISDADHDRAVKETVRVRGPAPGQTAAYFTDFVRQELERRLGEDAIAAAPGTRIFTTLDLGLQRLAETAVERGLERLETRVPRLRRTDPAERLQAALLALDPVTGHIRALVGGRNYEHSQFNRAALARRQPGSAFKPFVFLAALKPVGSDRPLMTAATFVEDTPLTVTVEGRPWTPRNYGDHYEGRVTVRRALEQSLNAATVRIAQSAGLPAVVDTARALGLAADMKPIPALALGAFEVTPLDLARAYAPFVNSGVRPPSPSALRAVRDADGTPLEFATEAGGPVISPAEAYLITSLLQGVVRVGTAAGLADVAAEVAGKTGTTNDGRDAWFVGYSSKLLTVVWVGFDGSEAHGLSGAQAALPIWTDFMRQAHDLVPAPPFAVPAGVTLADVDTATGKLANRHCPMVARETFLAGTEPEPCTEHGGVTDQISDWWRRLRGWFGR